MHLDANQVLRAAAGPGALSGPATPPGAVAPRLLIAGATGALGRTVLAALVGSGHYASACVLARAPLTPGLRAVTACLVPGDEPAGWPAAPAADVALVLFDPPRGRHGRERALWTPLALPPDGLPRLGAWLATSGAHTLAVVLPHDIGRLPEAFKHGLADRDEQALAALGFGRLLLLRSARRPPAGPAAGLLPALARWMLSITRFMVPAQEQPVHSARVARFLALALELAPPGVHVAAPELVWRAAQGEPRAVAQAWLRPAAGDVAVPPA